MHAAEVPQDGALAERQRPLELGHGGLVPLDLDGGLGAAAPEAVALEGLAPAVGSEDLGPLRLRGAERHQLVVRTSGPSEAQLTANVSMSPYWPLMGV